MNWRLKVFGLGDDPHAGFGAFFALHNAGDVAGGADVVRFTRRLGVGLLRVARRYREQGDPMAPGSNKAVPGAGADGLHCFPHWFRNIQTSIY